MPNFRFSFAFAFFVALNSWAQKPMTDAKTFIPTSLSGVWADSLGSSFKNQQAVFAVTKDQVFMSHYLEFNGQPFVEHGMGDRKVDVHGDTLIYAVEVTRGIPGWATSGKHFLVLDSNKTTLRGTFEDNKGNKGALVFKRVYPKP
jgi:hypothetical protein